MSLLSYSSPWTSDNDQQKKRVPTMGGIQRKTIKNRANIPDEYESVKLIELPEDNMVSMRGNAAPESIDDYLEKQQDRNAKVNSILNKITSFSTDDKLGDFNPMPYPATITKKNADQRLAGDNPIAIPSNPLMPKTTSNTPTSASANAYYRPTESNGPQYASYRTAYGKEGLTVTEPYYAKMGISERGGSDKMMDRLNYITQMLESIQMEKTNHITEEFLLYSLLGVFMIYIVDGFSRGGKYVR